MCDPTVLTVIDPIQERHIPIILLYTPPVNVSDRQPRMTWALVTTDMIKNVFHHYEIEQSTR